jgi:hypothetical protein
MVRTIELLAVGQGEFEVTVRVRVTVPERTSAMLGV